MTPPLPSAKTQVTTIRDLLLKNKDQIAMALPRFMSVDRMIRTVMTSVAVTPGLLDCTPRSLLGAVIMSAQLGLEPGVMGQAYFIPFRNSKAGTTEIQFIIGYLGLLSLCRRSGTISTIQAHEVYEKDTFTYAYGLNPILEHRPSQDAEPGNITHFYAVARLKDGGGQFEVMTLAQIEKHRDRYSRAAKQGPWVSDFTAMAKKTVLRRLCKLLPASVELQTAVSLDERAELQLPQGLTDLAPDDEKKETPSTLDALTAKMSAANDITS
jgi:recombination protein RecT